MIIAFLNVVKFNLYKKTKQVNYISFFHHRLTATKHPPGTTIISPLSPAHKANSLPTPSQITNSVLCKWISSGYNCATNFNRLI